MISEHSYEYEEYVLLLTVQKHHSWTEEAGALVARIRQGSEEIVGGSSEHTRRRPTGKAAADRQDVDRKSTPSDRIKGAVDSRDAGRAARPRHSPCVLLVEDNEGDVFIIQEALREHTVTCDVTVLSDGESALRLFDELDRTGDEPCPELVLLDLNLPRRSGHAVLERIRHSVRCSSIPVVIVTSSDSQRDLAENQRLGATAYFRKPSSLEQFLDIGKLVKSLLPAG